jgi:alpha-N-arabinofuranosidase
MQKALLLAAAVLALTSPLSPALKAQQTPDTSTWAQFNAFTYNGKVATTPKAGEFLNPVVAGFHPDPTVCRVGEDYYLVNSAFNYFPSLPIFHSKDLVNWTQIGNVLDRPSQFPMRGGAMDRGTYAPTIRYNKGTFYVVNTLVGSALNNFYVTAKDPKGPWSEPIKLDGIGGIDPDFFFDDDGKCYVSSCDDPVGPAQYSGHRAIKLQEMDLEKQKPIGEKIVIINGGTDIAKQPHWCEGPHIYKIKGKYYAMCAQGGTSTAHTEVIFKADNVRGPYVPWDKNPILSQMALPDNRPDMVTCTGHADLVQTQNNEWWAVFLGCQPYDGRNFNTGRETFLLPVSWTDDGWPVILPPNMPVPLTVKKPNLPAGTAPVAQTGNISYTDNFESDTLASYWTGVRVPQSQWYVSSKAAKSLFLQPREVRLTQTDNPSFLVVRQQNNDFSVSVKLTAQPKTADCVAGLAAFMNETHFYAIDVKIAAGKLTEISVEQAAPTAGRGGFPGGGRGMRGRGGATQTAPASQAAPAAPPASTPAPAATKLPEGLTSIELKIEGAGPVMKCFYKTGSGEFTQVGQDLQSSFLSTDTAGGFQGVMLGVFAHN